MATARTRGGEVVQVVGRDAAGEQTGGEQRDRAEERADGHQRGEGLEWPLTRARRSRRRAHAPTSTPRDHPLGRRVVGEREREHDEHRGRDREDAAVAVETADHGCRSRASSRMLGSSSGSTVSSRVATVTPIVGRRLDGCGRLARAGIAATRLARTRTPAPIPSNTDDREARRRWTTPRSSATQPHTTRPTTMPSGMPTTRPMTATVVACHATVGAHLPALVSEGLEDSEVVASSTYRRHRGRSPTATTATTATNDGEQSREPFDLAQPVDLRRRLRTDGLESPTHLSEVRPRLTPHRSPAPSERARSRRWARRPLSRGRPGSARRPRPVAAGRRSGSAGTRSDPRSGTVRSRPTSPPARSPRVAFLPSRASLRPTRPLAPSAARGPRRSPAHPHHGSSGTCSQGRVGRRSRCRRNRATIPQRPSGHARTTASVRTRCPRQHPRPPRGSPTSSRRGVAC